MKKLLTVLLAAVCLLSMTGCCFHEWQEADCVTPKTCLSCGETEGEALGHDWKEADCVNPKTCATCGETEGEALGHDWQEATTEAPKTCAACGETEGERIITDERFTTAACKDLFGTWTGSFEADGEMMELEGFEDKVSIVCTLVFNNDGTATMSIGLEDMDAFKKSVADYTMAMLYDNFAASGISRDEADDAMLTTYGMTMEQFVELMVDEMDWESYFGDPVDAVYYVQDGSLYMGDSWDEEMEPSAFTLNGDTLTIDDAMFETNALTLTRVTE